MIEFHNVRHYTNGCITIDTYKIFDNGNVHERTIELENKEDYQKWRQSQGYNKPEKKLNKLSDIKSFCKERQWNKYSI